MLRLETRRTHTPHRRFKFSRVGISPDLSRGGMNHNNYSWNASGSTALFDCLPLHLVRFCKFMRLPVHEITILMSCSKAALHSLVPRLQALTAQSPSSSSSSDTVRIRVVVHAEYTYSSIKLVTKSKRQTPHCKLLASII